MYMIKNTLKLFLGGLTSLLIKQASAQLQNGSFEKWDTTQFFMYEVINPQSWISTNLYNVFNDLPYGCTPTTDSRTGKYALKLENFVDTSGNPYPAMVYTNSGDYFDKSNPKFKVIEKATKLIGFYKFSSPQTDSFEVSIVMYQGDETVGGGHVSVSEQTNVYTKFECVIDYITGATPDSAAISIISSMAEQPVAGTTLILDDLLLEGVSTGIKTPNTFVNSLQVYPNPASDYVNVGFKLTSNSLVSINILDITGKVVATLANNANILAGNFNNNYSLNGIKPGLYFVTINTNVGSSISQKFIVR